MLRTPVVIYAPVILPTRNMLVPGRCRGAHLLAVQGRVDIHGERLARIDHKPIRAGHARGSRRP